MNPEFRAPGELFPATSRKALRVGISDTECRPLHYSDWKREDQMTGVAWKILGEDNPVECRVLQQNLSNERDMFAEYLEWQSGLDILIGHYWRKHDGRLIVDHCIRLGFALPTPLLVLDTMLDMVGTKGLGKSQENLSTTFGLGAEKHHMCGAAWRIANTLCPEGRADTRKRVTDDVLQNEQLYLALLARGLLGPPGLWRP